MNLSVCIDNKTFAQSPLRPVLQDVRFEIAAQEFIAIVGPSGCGKSTLLNIVAGLDQSFSGRVDWPAQGDGDHRLGYVFQNPRLLPWLTVRDNIRLVIDNPNMAAGRVDDLLEAMELNGYADYHPGRISVGMQRRVALARAFAVAPQLLLMDEAFVSLDAPTAKLLRSLLLRVWGEHRSRVLFATHDLREATQLADRILFLSQSPARVIAEVDVKIPREQRTDENLVDVELRGLQRQFEVLYGSSGRTAFTTTPETRTQSPSTGANPCRQSR